MPEEELSRRLLRPVAVFTLSLLLLGLPRSARAEPQLSAALTIGPAFRNLRGGPVKPALHLGGRFDALFFRSAQRDMGLGPYVDVGTSGFDSLETGGGLEWLIPAGGSSFIVSGGAEARVAAGTVQPGVTWGLFWGSRSYNFHSIYGYGVGMFAQGRYGLGDLRPFDVVAGLQVDAVILALPFLLLVNAAR